MLHSHSTKALHYTKEISKKYKGKFWIQLFSNFRPLNLLKSYLMALVCILEVLMHLLRPILSYLGMTNVWCFMCHCCQKCQKCHFWGIWHLTFVWSRYGNMGVKSCIRTSGIQTKAIKQLFSRFIGQKFEKSDYQNFPLYFLIFPLYNVRPLCYGCVTPRKKFQY